MLAICKLLCIVVHENYPSVKKLNVSALDGTINEVHGMGAAMLWYHYTH